LQEFREAFKCFLETFTAGNDFEAYYLRALEVAHRTDGFRWGKGGCVLAGLVGCRDSDSAEAFRGTAFLV
jgi:hypothetical protein